MCKLAAERLHVLSSCAHWCRGVASLKAQTCALHVAGTEAGPVNGILMPAAMAGPPAQAGADDAEGDGHGLQTSGSQQHAWPARPGSASQIPQFTPAPPRAPAPAPVPGPSSASTQGACTSQSQFILLLCIGACLLLFSGHALHALSGACAVCLQPVLAASIPCLPSLLQGFRALSCSRYDMLCLRQRLRTTHLPGMLPAPACRHLLHGLALPHKLPHKSGQHGQPGQEQPGQDLGCLHADDCPWHLQLRQSPSLQRTSSRTF